MKITQTSWIIFALAGAGLAYTVFTKKGLQIKSYPELVKAYKDIANTERPPGIPLAFVLAMIYTESGGDPKAIGDNGKSLGLMQLQKGAWQDSGVPSEYNQTNAFNPVLNIRAGTWYLNSLKNILGDFDNAVICYNIGIGNFNSGKLLDRGKNYLATVKKHRDRIIVYL